MLLSALVLGAVPAFAPPVSALPIQQRRQQAGRQRADAPERRAQTSLARETLTRELPDGVTLTFDSYPAHARATERGRKPPVALCFHMAGASRGEYRQIAPQLVKRGMTAIAFDQRAGGDRIAPPNATAPSALEVLGKKPSFTDAYADIEAGVAIAKELYPGAPLLLLGSSYSASLVLRYAGEHPDDIAGVFAFSPGNYLDDWKIEEYAAKITAPTYITCGSGERELALAEPLAAAIPANNRFTFWPNADLEVGHGAHALATASPDVRKRMWGAMREFFDALGPATFQRPERAGDRARTQRRDGAARER